MPGSITPSKRAVAEVRVLIDQQAALIDGLDKASMRALLPALIDAKNELTRGLAAWIAQAPGNDERYTAHQHRKAMLALDVALRRAAALGEDVQNTLVDNGTAAGELSAANLTEQVARFGRIFGESLNPIDLPTAALIAKGDRLRFKHYENSAARYAGAVGEDIRHQFAVGVAKGETFGQLKARLVRLGGPSGRVFTRGKEGDPGAIAEEIAEGLFRRHRHWAERLVRTELIEAYNDQHEAGIDLLNEHRDAAVTSEYLKRWDASLDKRICPVCRGLDRRTARAGENFPGVNFQHPPAHPNCRCVVVAWHASWGDMAGETPTHDEAPPAPPPPVSTSPTPRVRKPRAAAATMTKALPAPPPPSVADMEPAAKAIAGGRWDDGRQALEHDIARVEGYPLSDVGGTRTPTVSVKRIRPGIAGMFNPMNHHIQIQPDQARAAQRMARAMTTAAGRAETALASEKIAARARGDMSAPLTQEDLARGRDAHGMHTLVHETMHGHGPLRVTGYKGAALAVEEMTTEMAARRYLRLRAGIPLDFWSSSLNQHGIRGGAYNGWIEATTRSISATYGVPAARAQEILEEASDLFKRRATATIAGADEATAALGADIHRAAGGASDTDLDFITRQLHVTSRLRP